MTSGLTTQQNKAQALEQLIIQGDLASLTPDQRLTYYHAVCDSTGLNPLTKPFDYIRLNGKLTLYALRGATDQLRKLHGVSIQIVNRERIGDVYVVTARATDKTGRVDESTGAVSLGGQRGDSLANAYMKAETKAKRRVTLSLVGLGMLDENEVVTVASAEPVNVDQETGEVIEHPKPQHWIDDENVRKRFWSYCRDTLSLGNDEVYEALGVEHVHDYTGTMQDAKVALDVYIQSHAEPVPEPA